MFLASGRKRGKNFFRLFGPQFGPKIRGGGSRAPQAPPLDAPLQTSVPRSPFPISVTSQLPCLINSGTWNNYSLLLLKFVDDLHIMQTLKYGKHNCFKHLKKKKLFVAFDSSLCYFLTYLLDWYLLNVSGTCTPVSLCHTCRLYTHSFLTICSTLVSLWLLPLWFFLARSLQTGADLGGGCRGCAPPPPRWTAVF